MTSPHFPCIQQVSERPLKPPPQDPSAAMPSLFRFLMLVGLLGGLAYGAMFSLATMFEPKPREITVTIPPDKFLKR